MSASKVLIGCWLAKAGVITEGFMGLRHAPVMWRLLLFGWPLAMACGILFAMMV